MNLKFRDYYVVAQNCDTGNLIAIHKSTGEVYELEHEVTEVVVRYFVNSSFAQMYESMKCFKKIKSEIIKLKEQEKIEEIELLFEKAKKDFSLIDSKVVINDDEYNRKGVLKMEKYKEEIEKCNDPSELGNMLSQAAKEGDIDLVQLIIDKGVADINYNGKDKVFVGNPTPLQWAVIGGDINIVKLLLENGADVSITDEWGYRPFNEAAEARNNKWGHRALDESIGKNDKEILEIIKSYEPKEWHQHEWCEQRLKNYELPNEVIEFLSSENRKIDLEESEWTEYIEFYNLDEVRVFKWNNMTFVDLLHNVDGYDNIGAMSWIPEHKSFACLDMEHEKFGFIPGLTWSEFMASPARYIDGSLSWEFCENDDE
ncbi:ankyrin repeat domain-containing protein [Clostridium tagluense]|uniref:ankyrin repeat domain-containing protein n=1 Tax=Clostridium tagluense TaxID=360422 RepID=UPI00209B0A4E|nr:ankyrin repeat domain-containing protein [Clostridium tagluense]